MLGKNLNCVFSNFKDLNAIYFRLNKASLNLKKKSERYAIETQF